MLLLSDHSTQQMIISFLVHVLYLNIDEGFSLQRLVLTKQFSGSLHPNNLEYNWTLWAVISCWSYSSFPSRIKQPCALLKLEITQMTEVIWSYDILYQTVRDTSLQSLDDQFPVSSEFPSSQFKCRTSNSHNTGQKSTNTKLSSTSNLKDKRLRDS